MKVSSFFKILNRKINKYDKLATNPFLQPHKIIVVWVEDSQENVSSIDIERDEN